MPYTWNNSIAETGIIRADEFNEVQGVIDGINSDICSSHNTVNTHDTVDSDDYSYDSGDNSSYDNQNSVDSQDSYYNDDSECSNNNVDSGQEVVCSGHWGAGG